MSQKLGFMVFDEGFLRTLLMRNQYYYCGTITRLKIKNLEENKMADQIKVLIGNDTADRGMAWAGALKRAGMYAITRR